MNQPLARIDPKYIWNLDEKPLMPDLIKGAAISFDGVQTQPLTGNRGTSWTLLFWTSAAGESLAPLVIFPEPLLAQRAELGLALLSNPCTENQTDIQPRMRFAPNGWMNSSVFETELRNVLPELRKNMPFDQAGVLIFDAHTTHISERATNIARFFGFHLLTIPSHCSILFQPLDNFFNGEFSRLYRQAYQEAWVHNRSPRAADKLRSVLLAYRETSKKTTECKEAWRRCGIEDGFPSSDALRPEKFFIGETFRDKTCPPVVPGYLRVLFSWENILAPTSDTLSGAALKTLAERAETASEIKKTVADLVQLMNFLASEPIEELSLVLGSSENGPSTYFLPRVRNTITHNADLLRSQQLHAQASISGHSRSPEVMKEINAMLSSEIAAGTIITSQMVFRSIQISEAVVAQRNAAQQHRLAWKNAQEPIWKSLLQHAINQNLVPPNTKLSKQSVLKMETLKEMCKKLRISQSGAQVCVANRLLEHFGLTHRLVAYSPPEEETEVEADDLNDDPQL